MECKICKGKGTIMVHTTNVSKTFKGHFEEMLCGECGGNGFIIEMGGSFDCPKCNGKGFHKVGSGIHTYESRCSCNNGKVQT